MSGSPRRCWTRSGRWQLGPEGRGMNRFEYARPATLAEAVAAAAAPGAAYLAGRHQPDGPDEGRRDAPRPPGRYQPPPRARPDRAAERRRRAHWRARAQCGPGVRHGLRPAIPGRGGSAALGRLRPAAQRRDRGRQPAAADALRLFLRHRQRLQQTRPRRRLRRGRRREPPARHPGMERALHRHPPLRFLRAAHRPRRRGGGARARRDGATSRSRAFTGCPAARRSGRRCSNPAN